jgi:hypothetical protein
VLDSLVESAARLCGAVPFRPTLGKSRNWPKGAHFYIGPLSNTAKISSVFGRRFFDSEIDPFDFPYKSARIHPRPLLVSHNPPFDDLLELNGDGLRREPLAVRKATLETTVRAAPRRRSQREQC